VPESKSSSEVRQGPVERSIEAGAMFARLENGNNHTVLKATFNWVFY
jgi:hypothetical protein